MPTYTYKCLNDKCDNKNGFEVVRSIKDDPLIECEKCGSKVERVWGSVGIVWKTDGNFGKSK